MDPLDPDEEGVEDLFVLAERYRCEVIDGRLVEKPGGGQVGAVGAHLIALLGRHVERQRSGLVMAGTCGYQDLFPADPTRVRKPDISFIARDRVANAPLPRGNLSIAPDLAVEVIAPGDTAEDIESRVADFLGAGTKLVWVLYPATASVWVIRKDGSGARLKGTQELTGEDVIPGFACQVQALFAAT
jgi:Uma2 family endonuclease